MLGYLALAGPFYIVVSMAQALTRRGHLPRRSRRRVPVRRARRGPAPITWHGTLHLVSGSIGFGCLITACFVIARSYARRGQHRAAVVSRVVGIVFGAAFAGIATGAGRSEINLGFTAAIIASYAWLTAVAAGLYRRTRLGEMASALPAQ